MAKLIIMGIFSIIFIMIIFSIIFIMIILLMVLYLFANHIKPLQKFYCKIGWHCHQKDYIYNEFDGASAHCTCKWCGYKGMVDSQGNLF